MSELENLQTHQLPPSGTPEAGDVVRLFRGTQTMQCLTSDLGGGFVPARNVGQVELVFTGLVVPASTHTLAPLVFSDGDEAMIDISTPTSAKPVNAGTYAFTLVVDPTTPDAGWEVHLIVDDDYYSINSSVFGTVNRVTTSATWYLEALSPFFVRIYSVEGLTVNGILYAQRLA